MDLPCITGEIITVDDSISGPWCIVHVFDVSRASMNFLCWFHTKPLDLTVFKIIKNRINNSNQLARYTTLRSNLLKKVRFIFTLISLSVTLPYRVTARKKILVILPEAQGQVAYDICVFEWSDMVHGCMVCTAHAETAEVWYGTSHVSAVKHTTSYFLVYLMTIF